MKNLESYGTQELSMKEMDEIEGGWLLFVGGVILGGLAMWAYNEYVA